MNALKNLWKTNPKVRVIVRAFVAAAGAYVGAAVIKDNPVNWKALLAGAIGAGIYAAVGILTPAEPKVGVKADVQP